MPQLFPLYIFPQISYNIYRLTNCHAVRYNYFMNLNLVPPSKQGLPEVKPIHVILASHSMGRKMLLDKLGIPFRVIVSNVQEEEILYPDPVKTLKKRAEAKLEEILKHPRVYTLHELDENFIIAADSMAILGKKIFGKADDRDHAREIVKSLMGKTHIFATAVNIVYLDGDKTIKKRWEKVITTKVTLRKLNKPELESYITRYDFSRFAAGYALNETPWDLVTKVDGSYTNVIGLPFEMLLPILRSLNLIV